MQLGDIPKYRINQDEIASTLTKSKMFGGKNPFDMKNPLTFTDDKKFKTTSDDTAGTWSITEGEETWNLEMKWDNGDTAKFEFAHLKDGSISFDGIEQSSDQYKDWHLNSMPEDGVPVKMTLKNHPGKALVRDKRDDEFFMGGKVRWYEVGDESKACIFLF